MGLGRRAARVPPVGCSSVPMMYSSVLLPDPLGPRTARFSPADSASDKLRSTSSDSARVGYCLGKLLDGQIRHDSEIAAGWDCVRGSGLGVIGRAGDVSPDIKFYPLRATATVVPIICRANSLGGTFGRHPCVDEIRPEGYHRGGARRSFATLRPPDIGRQKLLP